MQERPEMSLTLCYFCILKVFQKENDIWDRCQSVILGFWHVEVEWEKA